MITREYFKNSITNEIWSDEVQCHSKAILRSMSENTKKILISITNKTFVSSSNLQALLYSSIIPYKWTQNSKKKQNKIKEKEFNSSAGMDHELNENTNSHKWHYTHLSLPCALRSLFTYDISFPSVHLPCITFPFRALEKILKLPFADIYIHITKKKENVYTNTYTYTFIYEHVQGIIHFFGVSSNMVVALSDCCRKERTRIYKENLI